MVQFNDSDEFFETMAEGGTAYRFKDIEGIGPKTARKLKRIRGVTGPQDVADYSAEALADEASISESRAEKAIRAGGGNPGYSSRSSTGSVSAGGIADAMDSVQEKKAAVVDELGTEQVKRGLMAAGKNVERQDAVSSTRKQDQSEIAEAPEQDLLNIGRLAENFGEATKDPLDPEKDAPIEASDEEKERAVQPRLAARRELGGMGYDREEITSEFGKAEGTTEFQDTFLSTLFTGPDRFGEYDTDREEYARAKKTQSKRPPAETRVDNRRKAPVTDEITKWKSDPAHWDYPGVDTPVRGQDFFEQQ